MNNREEFILNVRQKMIAGGYSRVSSVVTDGNYVVIRGTTTRGQSIVMKLPIEMIK